MLRCCPPGYIFDALPVGLGNAAVRDSVMVRVLMMMISRRPTVLTPKQRPQAKNSRAVNRNWYSLYVAKTWCIKFCGQSYMSSANISSGDWKAHPRITPKQQPLV